MRPATLTGMLPLAVLASAACDPSGVSYKGPGGGLNTTDTAATTTPTDGGNLPSCDRRVVDGTCTVYVGTDWDSSGMQADCSAGNLNDNGCPPSDIGGCKFLIAQPLEYVVWYYQGLFFAATAEQTLQSDCEVNYGEWR